DLADVARAADEEDLEPVRELPDGPARGRVRRILHVLAEALDERQQLARGGSGQEEPAQPALVLELAARVALHDGRRVAGGIEAQGNELHLVLERGRGPDLVPQPIEQ